MEGQTDNSVMKLVKEGDTASLALLFERHHAPLFRYLLHMSGNRELSEDLVQEVFFRVLKYAQSYDSGQMFAAWLYRIARNAHLESIHKRRGEVAGDEFGEIKSAEPMPEELITRKQDTEFLQAALQKLPEDKREVLVLSRFQNLRYEEIARILQCEIGTVKVRVYRALKELREKFCELRGEKLYDV